MNLPTSGHSPLPLLHLPPMRRSGATILGIAHRTIARAVPRRSIATQWQPGLSWLVQLETRDDIDAFRRIVASGLGDIYALIHDDTVASAVQGPCIVVPPGVVESGDVIAIAPGRGEVQVLYRSSDAHHTVFLTNRCNSGCVMCSQPPTSQDDSWLIEEAKQVGAHMGSGPPVLGFTGGEPLLLREGLRDILDVFCDRLPNTQFEVLTNGRLLSDASLAKQLLSGISNRVSWMVPLYGHADFKHDAVVRAAGAFDETIGGLLNLHLFEQRIQLRVVLIKPVLEILPDLCQFVAMNLPFIRAVALMGCEPTGFARANRASCELDIRNYEKEICRSVQVLSRCGISTVLMNIPLCGLPKGLWSLAHRSISDWKQTYAAECADCAVRGKCCGLFAWHAHGWQPTVLKPLKERY